MCYRDSVPALDFSGIHLACLSGDNGNGKSAIIDAMTWALWGKARSKSADDLIHTTQNEMEVEFEFNVGPQLYRIIRKRSRPKKRSGAGQSSLEFQVKNDDGYQAVTGNTIDQTQEKIIETLHMDYDTFVNSAYLRQGHADEFTRQDPARRKEVLGSILGLDAYDTLEERAKELAHQHEADSALLENALKEIDAELTQKPAFEVELTQAQSALAELDKAAQEKESGLNTLRQKKELLEAKQAQYYELEKRLQGGGADLKRWEEQAAQHLAHTRQYEEIIGRRGDIESGYAQYTEIKKTVDDLDRKAMQSRTLEKRKTELEAAVEKAKNGLVTNHTLLQREITRLAALVNNLPALKSQITQAQARAQSFQDNEAALAKTDQSAHDIQTEISRLEAEFLQLQKNIAEAGEKLDMIARHSPEHTAAKCPLCDQPLTREALELLQSKLVSEKQAKTALAGGNREAIARKREEYTAALKEKTRLETALTQEKIKARGQEESIKSKIKEIETESAKLNELEQTKKVIESNLTAVNYASAEQATLAAIEQELDTLGYDLTKHEQARQQLKPAELYEKDKNRLDEALRLHEQEKAAAAKAQSNAQTLQASLKEDSLKRETLSAELTGLPEIHEKLAGAEGEYKEANLQRSKAQEAVGSVRARLQRLAELENRKKENEGQRTQSAKEETIYRELMKAFGKNGIQALIIDAALPELANEADKLLTRLTDGRMHINFNTQKETKKGTVQETLDIAIADELGTRNYEMFSGGEAFRINFAVRIALSRLLARRAGAPLPTLIIDEGFGTQDSSGMEKLKEAINSIQGDFEKILVITHMDDLKDAFPNRIDVVKTAGGSTINVN
jgi:DNA repair protein SbcC/Rad50